MFSVSKNVMNLVIAVVVFAALPLGVWAQEDLFHYGEENREWEEGTDYGQRKWDQVECDDIEDCYGWPEKWYNGVGWRLRRNDCEDCRDGDNDCGSHHQSPINLDRQWGKRKQMGDIGVRNCGDNHWMKYEGGTCTFEHMKEANAISVERHALRISQPLEEDGNDYRLNCLTQGKGRIFSRLDMSGGFSQWWFLNHVEIHTPSEHTQNGKRYAAEVHLGHFYTARQGIDNGSNNRMATIGVFMDAKDEYEPYPQLDKLICEWRRQEERIRKECDLGSVETKYPGCFPYNRVVETSPFRDDGRHRRHLNETKQQTKRKPRLRRSPIDPSASPEEQTKKLKMDPENWREPDWTEEEWAKFQEEYSRRHPLNATKQFDFGRHLIDYEHVPYDNYQFMTDCRTEFYFRYEGTMTYPPCFTESSRDRTNVWRFMKDPIRINTRQEKEMHRLLRERIAPLGSYDGSPAECKPDTAAKILEDGTAWVARDLQELDQSDGDDPGSVGHDNYFCECDDWGSKIPEEREWCSQYRNDDDVRWVTHPYNYGGFNGI